MFLIIDLCLVEFLSEKNMYVCVLDRFLHDDYKNVVKKRKRNMQTYTYIKQ